VMLIFLISCVWISIHTHFHPIPYQSQAISVCTRLHPNMQSNPPHLAWCLPTHKPESPIGRDYPSILGLLKDGKTAQIRICKQDATLRSC